MWNDKSIINRERLQKGLVDLAGGIGLPGTSACWANRNPRRNYAEALTFAGEFRQSGQKAFPRKKSENKEKSLTACFVENDKHVFVAHLFLIPYVRIVVDG